ncbi:MAG: hypothetical protein JWO68_3621 [Actinomycetia bacterium]|nr:hypothetical protein [Actinomycetes bacterium]
MREGFLGHATSGLFAEPRLRSTPDPRHGRVVRAFACPSCRQLVVFENSRCLRCGTALGVDPETRTMVAAEDWAPCANAAVAACNWVVPGERAGERCRSCALTRTRPADGDVDALAAFAQVERAKRRLVFQLLELEVPLAGLAFDLLSSREGPVVTGHAGGLVTIDLAESDDAHRAAVRASLGEPYRTVLGHLRHEIGHFAWMVLVEGTPAIERFRALFGDEREDYAAALERHYGAGGTRSWWNQHVTAYAAAHPWEDWAETFAHYLHLRDTLETAAAYGVVVAGPAVATDRPFDGTLAATPVLDPGDEPFDALLAEWLPLTYALNALNRSMGAGDLYPFVLNAPVVRKLAFVHDLLRNH